MKRNVKPRTLEDVIQSEKELIETIQQSSKRLTRPVLFALLKTFLGPYAIFMGLWLLGSSIRNYVDLNVPDGSLNNLTTFSTTLAMLAITWVAWRWSEKRFGGLNLMRHMMAVSRAVFEVERAIDAAKTQPESTPAAIQQIEALTQRAWNIHVQSMRAAGLDVSPAPSSES